jgi:LytR cell envelope-related transcriptional attenuator
VTILGSGDLVPPRRGGGRTRPLLVLLLLAGLAAAGWFGWSALRGSGRHAAAATVKTTCTTPTPSPAPQPAAQVSVRVLNGTATVGLAHSVAAQLAARGFHVVSVGNGPALHGPAQVAYAAADQPAALSLAEQVLGADLRALPTVRDGVVELDIGSDFRRLATPAAAAAARARDMAAASPRPATCSTPHG